MKKKFSIILAFLICITSVMLAFSWAINPKMQASAGSLIFEESDLTNKVDIVDPNNLGVSFLSDKVENQNPFDNSTSAMMTGCSIVPKTVDSLKNINSTYIVNNFSVDLNTSIYMWIFFPDENINNLEISFGSLSGEILWSFPKAELSGILDNNAIDGYVYGWRLFEFCLSDAEMSDDVKNNLSSTAFNSFTIKYTNAIGTYVETNKNSFSFYHIYKADTHSSSSKIIDGQNYRQYKINENFVGQSNFFIDDEILFTNLNSLFEYLIIGQTNLTEFSSSNYSFEISVEDPNGESADKYFGEKFIFDTMGYYKILIKVKEYRASGSKVVLFEQLNFYVDYFAIGSFTNVDFEFEKGETTAITFNFSTAFIRSDDFEVKVSDKTKATITNYKIDGNTCHIEVLGLKKGKFDLIVEAKGKRAGTNEVKTYTLSTEAKVVVTSQKSSSEIFLWVIFSIYGVGFAIFILILLVKSRRVSVK